MRGDLKLRERTPGRAARSRWLSQKTRLPWIEYQDAISHTERWGFVVLRGSRSDCVYQANLDIILTHLCEVKKENLFNLYAKPQLRQALSCLKWGHAIGILFRPWASVDIDQ